MLTPTKIEEDQTRTEKPVRVEEHDIDFRVPGLSHAVVNEAQQFRVQELLKKIENHSHREALQAGLQQNNVHNPFNNNSKAMIRELGNVGLFELCEIVPKVRCLHCLLHWNQGIVYCNCGQLVVDSESRRKFHKQRLVALSIPNYVIKRGRSHGARHGKTEEQKEYHVDWKAWKGCFKKVDSQGGHCTSIHDRFLRDPRLSRITFRIRMDRRKVPRSGRTCKTKTHVLSLYRGISKDTKENGISP